MIPRYDSARGTGSRAAVYFSGLISRWPLIRLEYTYAIKVANAVESLGSPESCGYLPRMVHGFDQGFIVFFSWQASLTAENTWWQVVILKKLSTFETVEAEIPSRGIGSSRPRIGFSVPE